MSGLEDAKADPVDGFTERNDDKIMNRIPIFKTARRFDVTRDTMIAGASNGERFI